MSRRIRKAPRFPTEHEKEKLFNEILSSKIYLNTPKGLFLRWRDYTAIYLTFFCGLRPSECLNLSWEDIDFEHYIIRVKPYFNKEKFESDAALTQPACKALLHYREICTELGMNMTLLFPSMENLKPVSVSRMERIFRAHAKAAGILNIDFVSDNGQPQYNYSLYSGRHWFANNIYSHTNSDIAVQFLMRHRNRASSERYIRLQPEQINKIANFVFSN